MLLTGLWFGLAVVAGMATLGYRSVKAAVIACILILIGWQVAYHIAFGLAYYVNYGVIGYAKSNHGIVELIGGGLAGATGASVTWAAVAYSAVALRKPSLAVKVALVGAVLGLLLPVAVEPDGLIRLLLPWQVGVSALLGFMLVPPRVQPQLSSR